MATNEDTMIKRFRDHAANERTFLSWVRLAIGVMAFGFVIEKFEIYLGYLVHLSGQAETAAPSFAASLAGLVMMVLAALILGFALYRYVRVETLLRDDDDSPYRPVLSTVVIGVMLMIMLVFVLGYIGHQVFILAR